jgi:hypothetical protein
MFLLLDGMGTRLPIESVKTKESKPKNPVPVILLERACEISEETERYCLEKQQDGGTYLRDSVTKIRVTPAGCGSCQIQTNGHFPTEEEVRDIVCKKAIVFGANAYEYAPSYAGIAGEVFVDYTPLYRLSDKDVYRIMAARKHWEGQQSLDFG